jgi:LmbE family N-acetylglucosaminyl deacetylase
VRELGTILGVWAHPDDETYLMGGIMAQARHDDGRVVCVTATRGEEGSQDPVRWPPEKIAQIRTEELERALTILGVSEHHWLGYGDGACSEVPHADGVARVRSIIEWVAPDSILTFGPDGQTGHPDHVAVHRWTTDAFRASAGKGAHLYYAATESEWFERFGPELQPFGVWAPGTPATTPRSELAIDFELTDELLELKLAALATQVSQTEGFRNAVSEELWAEVNRLEAFKPAGK